MKNTTIIFGNFLKKIICILCITVVAQVSAQSTYYVSINGNNSQSGSQSNPWKTIQHAVNQVSSGDTVYVEQGTYSEQVNINKIGQAGAPITFIGVGTPTIGNGNNNVQLPGQHIVFEGFEIKNSNRTGIVISGANIQVRNCMIHDNQGDGVVIETSQNITVFGGKIYNNDVGVRLEGKATNLLLDNIDIYSTGGSNGKQEAGIKAWNGGGTTNWTMQNLKIHDHPAYGAEIMPSSSARMFDVFMTDCHFYNNGIGKPFSIPNITFRQANVLIQRVTNGTLERNIFERGMGWGVDIYTSNKYKVFNNLFLNNYDSQDNPVGPGFGLEVNASDETEVYNNTFYGNDTALLISYLDSGHDWPPGRFRVTVHNNIFHNSRKRDYLELLDKYEDDTTIIMNTNLRNQNPQFVDAGNGDFHLKPNSPAIDTGKTVNVTEDYDGVARPQGNKLDMGMYEYCVSQCGGGIIGPDGYTYAVEEQETIPISDVPYDIAYGQDGNYKYVTNQTQDTPCTNETFKGDPSPGVKKYCFIRESKAPYSGTPTPIPGTIEAENYDFGGAGRSYMDDDTANNGDVDFRENNGVDIGVGANDTGYAIGWMREGEWLEYTINVQQNGLYNFDFATASQNGTGVLGIDLDGNTLLTGIQVPQTNGWDDYAFFAQTAELTSGEHILRFKVENGGFNLDKINISDNSLSTNSFVKRTLAIHPNPSRTGVFKLPSKMDFKVYAIGGKLLLKAYSDQVDLSKFSKGMYLLRTENSITKIVK